MRKLRAVLVLILLPSLVIGTIGCSESEPSPTATPKATATPAVVQDSDGDGWTDAQEQAAGTDPHRVDTDGDGYWDPQDPNPLDASIPVATSTPIPIPPLAPTPTPTRTQQPPATPTQQPIPLDITLDYFGVKYAYGGNIQLVVLVSDGTTENTEQLLIPPNDPGFSMRDFEVRQLNMRVFHTGSMRGRFLKLTILAYHRDQLKALNLQLIDMMKWYYGEGIEMLRQLVESMPANDKRIGFYEMKWYDDESWGIGKQYNGVGQEDLRVWFSISSGTQPAPIQKPTLKPDVKIEDLSIPTQIKQCPSWYLVCPTVLHTLTLENREGHDITVEWQAHSSVTGDFDSGSISIPADSRKSMQKGYSYRQSGPVEITYTISYGDKTLDSRSVTCNVIP